MTALPSADLVVARLEASGIALPPGPVVVSEYGDSPELSDELLDLIRSGAKRAGTGLLWAHEYDREKVPEAQSIEIVLDHEHNPVLITRLTSVAIVPFDQVTAEYAAIEGEGDGSLASWREGHWAFFSRECARIGCTPKPDMPVVCNIFELLRIIPAGA